jgi:hypothetical protein
MHILVILSLTAADLTLSGPKIARPATTVTYTVSATDVGAAFQVDFTPATAQEKPTTFSNKTLTCATVDNVRRCILYAADNAALIPNGDVVKFDYTTPSTPGPVEISIYNALGAAPDGSRINFSLTNPIINLLVTRVDINNDGEINTLDTLAVVNAVLSNTCTPETDANGDSKCDVTDIQLVANAVVESLAMVSIP